MLDSEEPANGDATKTRMADFMLDRITCTSAADKMRLKLKVGYRKVVQEHFSDTLNGPPFHRKLAI